MDKVMSGETDERVIVEEVVLYVFEVEFPCGVCEKYVARDSAHALEFARANYENHAGDDEWEEPSVTRLPDDRSLRIIDELGLSSDAKTLAARDWARDNGPGFLCTNTW